LHRVCGVDLTKIPGIKEQAAQIIISELGLDMSPWNTEKQFSSFLGLCPNNLITGGIWNGTYELREEIKLFLEANPFEVEGRSEYK
jgi:hypothetical protein